VFISYPPLERSKVHLGAKDNKGQVISLMGGLNENPKRIGKNQQRS
jgi:hypothetical protein